MKLVPLLIFSAVFGGCSTVSSRTVSLDEFSYLLSSARNLLLEGELYAAKESVRQALEIEPESDEAQQLMAEIIEEEITGQLELQNTKTIEEYTDQERADAIKTWLERSQSYLDAKLYEQAMLAAEKVFLFDGGNIQASKLVDKIQAQALEQGLGGSLIIQRMYRTEIEERVKTYLEQAKQWLDQGRVGAATLALEKLLLLEPQHQEAQRLYKQVKQEK